MIDVVCTCGKKMRARDEAAGKRAKCPACGGTITVPAPIPVAASSVVNEVAQTTATVTAAEPELDHSESLDEASILQKQLASLEKHNKIQTKLLLASFVLVLAVASLALFRPIAAYGPSQVSDSKTATPASKPSATGSVIKASPTAEKTGDELLSNLGYLSSDENTEECARLYGVDRMAVVVATRDTMLALKHLPRPSSMQEIKEGAIVLGRERTNRGRAGPTFRAYCDLYTKLRRSGLSHAATIGTIYEQQAL